MRFVRACTFGSAACTKASNCEDVCISLTSASHHESKLMLPKPSTLTSETDEPPCIIRPPPSDAACDVSASDVCWSWFCESESFQQALDSRRPLTGLNILCDAHPLLDGCLQLSHVLVSPAHKQHQPCQVHGIWWVALQASDLNHSKCRGVRRAEKHAAH